MIHDTYRDLLANCRKYSRVIVLNKLFDNLTSKIIFFYSNNTFLFRKLHLKLERNFKKKSGPDFNISLIFFLSLKI